MCGEEQANIGGSVGQSFGFMEAENDFNGILQAIHDSMTYGSRVGLFAELHPIAAWIAKTTNQPVYFGNEHTISLHSVCLDSHLEKQAERENLGGKVQLLRSLLLCIMRNGSGLVSQVEYDFL